MHMPDDLAPLLDGLDEFDTEGFAARVFRLDPVLGEVMLLYAPRRGSSLTFKEAV